MWLTEYDEEETKEAFIAEGRAEGEAIGLAKAVDSLVAAKTLSLEEACKAVNITKDDYNHAKALAGEN